MVSSPADRVSREGRARRSSRVRFALIALICAVAVSLPGGAAAVSPTPAPSDVPLHTLSEQELTDMMVGAAILCTRGVNTATLIQRLRDAVRGGQTFRMIAMEDLPDDWLAFTSFVVGGSGAWPHVPERMERQGFTPDPNAPTAETVLAEHLGSRFDAIFQAEAGNAAAAALLAGARLGIPIVDGCPSGRCLPEVQMSPFFMNGITRAPLAAVTPYGDVLVLPRVRDDFRVEDILRGVAVASGGRVTVAANALEGAVLKRHLIPGVLSKSIRLGRAAREAVARGADPVRAVAEAGEGFVLFRGVVRRSDSRGERGFGWTEAHFDGVGPFSGSTYRIFNKNENLVAWRDGRLDAAAPDLISALDPKTGWAMRSGPVIGSFVVGEELAIVGFPNHRLWRTPKAIDMLGPRYFGFTDEYVPIEELQRARQQ